MGDHLHDHLHDHDDDDGWTLGSIGDWPVDDDGLALVPPRLPEHLTSPAPRTLADPRHHARVDDLPPPYAPFARHLTDDEMDRPPDRYCFKSGLSLLAPRTFDVLLQPCRKWPCARCGPRRAQELLSQLSAAITTSTPPYGAEVYLYRVDGPSVVVLEDRKRVVKAIRKGRGDYAWLLAPGPLALQAQSSDATTLIVLSSVDHATRRGGAHARTTLRLAPDDALAYLTRLLWHGAYKTLLSAGWKSAPTDDDTLPTDDDAHQASIGYLRLTERDPIRSEARVVHARRGGSPWPEVDDAPASGPRWLVDVFGEARDIVRQGM